ncbi:YqgE/AlgH family protein [Carboxylicivirga sp. M1479]|uniref:YqgE/AlgH family protein n=1 Tax=Carboxylicivirga sp. M1479 TaxID=2594476 RepID=UPI00117851C8|nr:YqgE/AlgH family protein [Carboxylicivirga sp. M1479]TRX70883.1 YqgE/AlgH family protein [Carboxylicivirga sp. M1479]
MKSLNFDIFKGHKPGLEPEIGRVLIAEPFLQGPYFNRSIVIITEHGADGAVGFVLNKSSELYPDEVIEDLFNFKGELYVGGPVASNTLYFIHSLGDKVPDSVKITDTLYWGGDFEVIKNLINTGMADYSQVKFFAGYSGWSPGQLESEIKEESWIVANVDDKLIMDDDIDHIWKQAMEGLGDIFKAWTNFPENPSYN